MHLQNVLMNMRPPSWRFDHSLELDVTEPRLASDFTYVSILVDVGHSPATPHAPERDRSCDAQMLTLTLTLTHVVVP